MRLTFELEVKVEGSIPDSEIERVVNHFDVTVRYPFMWGSVEIDGTEPLRDVKIERYTVKLIRAEEDIPVDSNS